MGHVLPQTAAPGSPAATCPDQGKEEAQLSRYLANGVTICFRAPRAPPMGSREARGPAGSPCRPHHHLMPSPCWHLVMEVQTLPTSSWLLHVVQTPVEGPVWFTLQNHMTLEL